jgi:DNA modification methylase
MANLALHKQKCAVIKFLVEKPRGNKQKRHKHQSHDILMHPTQKPFAVSDKLIKAAKPKDSEFTMLVSFAGSSCECLATIKNGGNFIAFEINSDYRMLAEKILDIEIKETETTNDADGYFAFI